MKENYCVFQTAICGTDHLEKHELKRDCAGCYENENVKIVVAAGGRNDRPYIRSFIGASLAVKVVLEASRIFAAGADEKSFSQTRRNGSRCYVSWRAVSSHDGRMR